MKKIAALLICIIASNIMYSQTTLEPGDIAILQYNRGSGTNIKFITYKSLESGTVINFTDRGWTAATGGTFYSGGGAGEGTSVYTATSAVACGTVVTFNLVNCNLHNSGDQVLAYQGTDGSPTLLFLLSSDLAADTWTTSGAINQNSTYLPDELTNGVTATSFTETQNAIYNSTVLTGTVSAIKAAIPLAANWTASTTFSGTFNSTSTWNGTSWSIAGGDYFTGIINGTYDTSSDGDFTTCNCTVNSSQTLTVNSGGTVTVDENITNNGTILVESGGSVVQTTSTGTNSGTDYTVERTTTSQSSAHVFTYWSSPLTSSTTSAVAADAHLYYSFTAASQSWLQGNSSTSMTPAVGYAIEGPGSGTYPGAQTSSFSGAAFNNGTVSLGLSFSSDGDADNDWNLIGNPYPSAISANTFLSDNSSVLGGTLYLWTHNTDDDVGDNTVDDYAMYNAGGGTQATSGGTIPDGNLASTQGFFVQALSASNVNFTNSMRISANNTSFYKQTQQDIAGEKDRVWLNLTTDNSFSQILVGFFNDATFGVDRKYDGLRFLGQTNLNFYSIINDKNYGIQGLPSINKKQDIPLGFSTTETGSFKISIGKKEGKLSGSKIVLEDKLLDIEHRLDKSDYEFNSDEVGTFDDRFVMRIKSKKKTVKVKTKETKKINAYKKGDFLYVASLKVDDKINRVSIYTLNGSVFYDNKTADFEGFVPLKKLKTAGVYILKIQLDSGEIIIKKVII